MSKQLKFNHGLARLISQGKRNSCWRFFDDKNISVGDVVEVVDKIRENDPSTWQTIGWIRITHIADKLLHSMTHKELMEQGFSSTEDAINTIKTSYGIDVDNDSLAKIIHFVFVSGAAKGGLSSNTKKGMALPVTEAKLYADGGSRGNPGPSSCGVVIMSTDDSRILLKKGVYLGVTDNTHAEYEALKLGLEEAKKMGIRSLRVFMDNIMVVNQMKGVYGVKNKELWPIHELVKKIASDIGQISYHHLPRILNKEADRIVNDILNAVYDEQGMAKSV